VATVPTPAIGGNIRASDVLFLLGGSSSRKPSFRVHLNTAQTIANNSLTTIKWDTVDEDTDSGYSGTTGQYTVGTAGLWVYSARSQWSNGGTTTTTRLIEFQQNGVDVGDLFTLGSNDSSNTGRMVGSVILRCAAGDTVSVAGYQLSTASLTFGGSSTNAAFSGVWLGE